MRQPSQQATGVLSKRGTRRISVVLRTTFVGDNPMKSHSSAKYSISLFTLIAILFMTAASANAAPAVTAPANATADEGVSRSFSLGSFADAIGVGPWEVTVDWGDGTILPPFEETAPGTLTAQPHTFADNNTYTVNVTVAEAGGINPDTVTFDVTVANANPAITAVSSTTVGEGTASTVTVIASDPAGAADPLLYEFDFDNDGTYEVTPQPSPSATRTFADDGAYTVNMRVTDGDGGSFTGSTIVTVTNENPAITAVTPTTAATR